MIFRKTLILAIIVIAAAGLYYVNEARWSKRRDEAREEAKRLYRIATEEVREISLARAGESLTVVRRADGWYLAAPIRERAEQQLCDQMAEAASALQREMIVSEQPEDLGEFGLDPPSMVATFTLTAGETQTLWIGDKNPTSMAYYAKVPDQPAIFLIETFDNNRLSRSLYDLRDKTIISAPVERVKEVVYERSPLRIRVESMGDDRWMVKEPVEALASASKIRNFIQSFNYARAQQFVSESADDLSPYGLDEPAYRVSLFMKDEPDPKVFLLGNLDEAEEMIYVKVAKSSRVMTIRKDILEKFPLTAADFREKLLFGPDPAAIERIELVRAEGEIVVEKDATGQWLITRPISANADDESANTLAFDLTNLRIDVFLDDNPEDLGDYGLQEPKLTVRAWQEGEQAPRVLLVGGQDDANNAVYAKRQSEPAVFRIEAEPAGRLSRSIHGLREKHLYGFREEDIGKFAVMYPDRSFVFKRRGHKWLLQEPEKGTAIRWRVNNLLWEILSVEFVEIAAEDVPRAEMAKYGLDSPQVHISLWTTEGGPPDELIIGNPAPGKNALYAKLGEGRRLYLVAAELLEKLPRDAADFKER